MFRLLTCFAAVVTITGSGPLLAPTADAARTDAARTASDTPAVGDPADEAVTVDRGDVVDADRPSVSLRPTIEIVDAADDQLAAVDEALARFRRAGLPLPDLEITFFDETDDKLPCNGHYGLFRAGSDRWRVSICSDVPFVITHELAHAWERANLDDPTRATYTELRGFRTWNDPDAAWGDKAVEDAAFVVQQNLMARHVDVGSERWLELTSAYEELTGRVSPVLGAAGDSASDHDDLSGPR